MRQAALTPVQIQRYIILFFPDTTCILIEIRISICTVDMLNHTHVDTFWMLVVPGLGPRAMGRDTT